MIDATGLSPVCFRLFGVSVYWYGVAYVVGMFLALWLARLKLERPPYEGQISLKDVDAFVPWAWLGVLVGGRLGHILFFDGSYYFSHLREVIAFRDGGMSFHGGFLGVACALFFYCSKRSLPLLLFWDLAASVAPIGLFVGRLANFINNELYGVPTTLSWGCLFRGCSQPRHPTQIYEALLEGALTFVILQWAGRKRFAKERPGFISWLFLQCYALSRIGVDFVKEAPRYYELTTGQLLSLAMILLGGLLWHRLSKPDRPS